MKVYYSSSHCFKPVMVKTVLILCKSLKIRNISTFLNKNLTKFSKKLVNNSSINKYNSQLIIILKELESKNS